MQLLLKKTFSLVFKSRQSWAQHLNKNPYLKISEILPENA
jgi:hypothetical protein